MQAAEAAGGAFLQVFEQGDQGEVLAVQARQDIQRSHQLLQAPGDAVQQLVLERLAVPVPEFGHLRQADQHVAHRAAAGFHLADAVGQLLLEVALVAQAGGAVHQVALLQAGDVLGEQAVFHQQALQRVAQAVGGEHAGHQLLVHRRLADEVVHATVEGLGQGVVALLAGEQDDVGVVVAAFVELAHPRGQLQAVHLRHQPVGEQHAHRLLFQQVERFAGAAGEAHVLVAGLAQRATDHGAGELGIVDHQDAEMVGWHGKDCLATGGKCRLSVSEAGRGLVCQL